ncbi:hypothetical protein ACH5A2_38710 [Streptomyces collinus]|uniref:hypothetical protein n=1 Tax=Streptomyces collinus TaxID=42684 RepID=UPI00378BF7CB
MAPTRADRVRRLLGKPLGHDTADSARAAGDQRDPVGDGGAHGVAAQAVRGAWRGASR